MSVGQYEKAFAGDPAVRRHPFINHEYGAALVRLGRVAEAQAAYADRMTGTPEERAGALRSLALLEAHLGRFARGRELLDEAVTASGVDSDTLGSAIGHVLRADVSLVTGDTSAAKGDLAALERWAAARPPPYEIVAHGVKLLARSGQPARARTLLRRLGARTNSLPCPRRLGPGCWLPEGKCCWRRAVRETVGARWRMRWRLRRLPKPRSPQPMPPS